MSCPFIVVKILCHLFLVRCFINKIQIDLRGNTKFKICPAKVLRVKFLFVSIGVKLPTSFVSQNVCVFDVVSSVFLVIAKTWIHFSDTVLIHRVQHHFVLIRAGARTLSAMDIWNWTMGIPRNKKTFFHDALVFSLFVFGQAWQSVYILWPVKCKFGVYICLCTAVYMRAKMFLNVETHIHFTYHVSMASITHTLIIMLWQVWSFVFFEWFELKFLVRPSNYHTIWNPRVLRGHSTLLQGGEPQMSVQAQLRVCVCAFGRVERTVPHQWVSGCQLSRCWHRHRKIRDVELTHHTWTRFVRYPGSVPSRSQSESGQVCYILRAVISMSLVRESALFVHFFTSSLVPGVARFNAGEWVPLLELSLEFSMQGKQACTCTVSPQCHPSHNLCVRSEGWWSQFCAFTFFFGRDGELQRERWCRVGSVTMSGGISCSSDGVWLSLQCGVCSCCASAKPTFGVGWRRRIPEPEPFQPFGIWRGGERGSHPSGPMSVNRNVACHCPCASDNVARRTSTGPLAEVCSSQNTASQNQFSPARASSQTHTGRRIRTMGIHGFPATEEDQSMIDNDHGEDVRDDGSESGRLWGRGTRRSSFCGSWGSHFWWSAGASQSVPLFMRGFHWGAMRLACKTVQGRVQENVDMETRSLLHPNDVVQTTERWVGPTPEVDRESQQVHIGEVESLGGEKFDCCSQWRSVEPSQEKTTTVRWHWKQGVDSGADGRVVCSEAGVGGSCGRTWGCANVGHVAGFVSTPTSRAVMANFGQTDFGQLLDRFWPAVGLTGWPNRLWPIFRVLAKFSQPQKHDHLNPKDLNPTPQRPKDLKTHPQRFEPQTREGTFRGPTVQGPKLQSPMLFGPNPRPPSPGPHSAGPPKISFFFQFARHNFHSFVECWWCFWRPEPLKFARLGSRVVVWSPLAVALLSGQAQCIGGCWRSPHRWRVSFRFYWWSVCAVFARKGRRGPQGDSVCVVESDQHPSASRKDQSLEQGRRRATRVRGVDSCSKDGEERHSVGRGPKSPVGVLGSPNGHADFVRSFLEKKTAEHSVLLERIPACVVAILRCQSQLLIPHCATKIGPGFRDRPWRWVMAVSVQLNGDMVSASPKEGLRSAIRLRQAAHRAYWSDCLEMIRDRSQVWGMLGRLTNTEQEQPRSIAAARECGRCLERDGFHVPTWEDLTAGLRPDVPPMEEEDIHQPRNGWQHVASKCTDTPFVLNRLGPVIVGGRESDVAFAGRPISCLLSHVCADFETRFDHQLLWVLLMSGLRLPGLRCVRCLGSAGEKGRCLSTPRVSSAWG